MHRLALFIAAVGLTLGVAAAATADGVTPAKLTNAGWTCFNDPGAPRIVCSDPGHGRPTPGDPDAPPSYNFKIFALDGTFTATSHLIRDDERVPSAVGPSTWAVGSSDQHAASLLDALALERAVDAAWTSAPRPAKVAQRYAWGAETRS